MADRMMESQAANPVTSTSIDSDNHLLRPIPVVNTAEEDPVKISSSSPRKFLLSLRGLNLGRGSKAIAAAESHQRPVRSLSGSPRKKSRTLRTRASSCSPEMANAASSPSRSPATNSSTKNAEISKHSLLFKTVERMQPSPWHSVVETKPFSKPILTKSQAKSGGLSCKLLVTVTVSGSAGPLRFLVDAKDSVRRVIDVSLRAYTREGRYPPLGLDPSSMQLYSCVFEALDPWQLVGNLGTRQFFLHRKKVVEEREQAAAAHAAAAAASIPWKLWWNVKSAIVCSA